MSHDSNTPDWREEYAYTLGVQAYVFSFPWVYLTGLRWLWVGKPKPAGYTDFDMAFNNWYHSRDVTTPAYQSGGSPNNDTLYISCMLDLRKDPVILEMPAIDSKYVSLMITAYDHYVNIPMATRLGRNNNVERDQGGKNWLYTTVMPTRIRDWGLK